MKITNKVEQTLSIIKPDPKAADGLSCGVPNSLNMSSNGEPGGNWKGKGFVCVLTIVVVEILTTDGINFSARSANDAGGFFAFPSILKIK